MYVTPLFAQTGDLEFSVHSTEKLDQSGANVCNVYSAHTKAISLKTQQAIDLPTGIYFENLPVRMYYTGPDIPMYIGFHVLGSMLDIGFTGELHMRVLNTNVLPITIMPGDLIGQLIYIKM